MPMITPLGKRWENLHSFWLIWLLAFWKYGYLSFISFFYIGIRARKWKWILSGFIYLIIVIVYFSIRQLVVKDIISEDHYLFDIALVIMLTSYVTIWVHAFWARKEYLQIIAERYIQKQGEQPVHQVVTEESGKATRKVEEALQQVKDKKVGHMGTIEINSASEAEIAELTGDTTAKEIVQARATGMVFHSLIDVIRVVHIKPHELAKYKSKLVFSSKSDHFDQQHKEKKQENIRGRIVDI